MDDLTGWWLDEYDGPRFWKFVDRRGGTEHENDALATASGECWTWLGAKARDGYGSFRLAGRMTPAHRIAYLDGSRTAKIPDGWQVDHLCRNHACVNPKHLDAVPRSLNVQRGSQYLLNRSECRNGHPLSAENVVRVKHSTSGAVNACRQCFKESKRRRYERQAAKTSLI